MMDDSPVSPPGAESFVAGSRVTPKELQDAERQIEQNYSALMDSMEASVPAQGEWFVPIGAKEKGRDSRVMLLRDVVERPISEEEKTKWREQAGSDVRSFTFVTDKGIMLYNMIKGYDMEPTLTRILSGEDKVNENVGGAGSVQEEDGDGLNIRMLESKYPVRHEDGAHRIPYARMESFGDEVDFGERVKKSIEKAGESAAAQNRRKLAELQRKAELPQRLSSMISSIPPRQ